MVVVQSRPGQFASPITGSLTLLDFINSRRAMSLLLLLLLFFINTGPSAALYFSQSDVSLTIPSGVGASPMKLLQLRLLGDDSIPPKDVQYEINTTKGGILTIDEGIIYFEYPLDTFVVVRAKVIDEVAIFNGRIKVSNVSENCEDYCFWTSSEYKIFENQPVTVIGSIGPDIYRHYCPDFHVKYEILNGSNYFHVIENEIFANALLDRDTLGSTVDVRIQCIVWNKSSGFQNSITKSLKIDILDQDDNPPVAQINHTVRIVLTDSMLGQRLDRNELMAKDADEMQSNRYTVKILGDVHRALNLTYDVVSVEHPQRIEIPSSTVIFGRIYSATSFMPKLPYRVVLQFIDKTLLPRRGENFVNINLEFVGKGNTTMDLSRRTITYPKSGKVLRLSPRYSRIVQPSGNPGSKVLFRLKGSFAFNVTRNGGIVYVSDETILKSEARLVRLTLSWVGPEHIPSTATIKLDLFDNSTIPICNVTRSCANAKIRRDCDSNCGIGSGRCVWRTGPSPRMTERYETCSPNLIYCPDRICDDLERLDKRICPQDCVTESDVHFGEINDHGLGIKTGLGTCFCTDTIKCTCGPNLFKKSDDGIEKKGIQVSRVISTNVCGQTCIIEVVAICCFVCLVVVGFCIGWRYRVSRNEKIDDNVFFPIHRQPKLYSSDPEWEFPRTRLVIEQLLGEGEFGRVLKARATDIGKTIGPIPVAVKTLKENSTTSELADLLSEYQLLKEIDHPNVIRLLGACTTPDGPFYLIIEFAEYGSLRNYLKSIRTSDTDPKDILSFAWQISKGMAYLADIKLVHRDLAARNVLLAADKVCKISDFGLTRDVYEDDAYLKRSKGRVPVKWMAPESLADHVYTSKSDVWSFGILLWEMIALGASPYPGIDVHNLYNLLKAGYRMDQPTNCSNRLYKIMVSCWREEPNARPTFKELIRHWEDMLHDGVQYLVLNPKVVQNQVYFSESYYGDKVTGYVNESKTECYMEMIGKTN